MRYLQLLTLTVLAAAFVGVFAACGDDEERLTDEEYFAELTRLDKEFDERGEADEAASAKDASDLFREAARDYDEALSDLNPPEDLQDEHDDLVDAIQTFRSAVEAVDFEEDAPAQEFFEHEDLAEPFAAVNAPFCAVQAVADDKGIEADVGCEEGEEGE